MPLKQVAFLRGANKNILICNLKKYLCASTNKEDCILSYDRCFAETLGAAGREKAVLLVLLLRKMPKF